MKEMVMNLTSVDGPIKLFDAKILFRGGPSMERAEMVE